MLGTECLGALGVITINNVSCGEINSSKALLSQTRSLLGLPWVRNTETYQEESVKL